MGLGSLRWYPTQSFTTPRACAKMNITTVRHKATTTLPSQTSETSLAVKNDNTREKKRPKHHTCMVSKANNKRRLLRIVMSFY